MCAMDGFERTTDTSARSRRGEERFCACNRLHTASTSHPCSQEHTIQGQSDQAPNICATATTADHCRLALERTMQGTGHVQTAGRDRLFGFVRIERQRLPFSDGGTPVSGVPSDVVNADFGASRERRDVS